MKFQFQIGAIRGRACTVAGSLINKFQFQIGAIRGGR